MYRSARFDCQSRTYKYFFPRGLLDLQRMEDGGQNLVGSHDFRNFCKVCPKTIRHLFIADFKLCTVQKTTIRGKLKINETFLPRTSFNEYREVVELLSY